MNDLTKLRIELASIVYENEYWLKVTPGELGCMDKQEFEVYQAVMNEIKDLESKIELLKMRDVKVNRKKFATCE